MNLFPLLLLAAYVAGGEAPAPSSLRVDEATYGGIKVLYIEVWGAKGDGSVNGPVVPDGEVWLVRGCGAITDDGNWYEYMMQIGAPYPGHTPNPQLLVPIQRNVGTAAGTPPLAVEREFVLLPREWAAVRSNGLKADRKIGIRMTAFVFPESELPNLIK